MVISLIFSLLTEIAMELEIGNLLIYKRNEKKRENTSTELPVDKFCDEKDCELMHNRVKNGKKIHIQNIL